MSSRLSPHHSRQGSSSAVFVFLGHLYESTGGGCLKLMTSLVNVPLKFQMLISQISNVNISNMPIFFVEKCEKLLQCKSFSHFFNKKYQCISLSSCNTLKELTS